MSASPAIDLCEALCDYGPAEELIDQALAEFEPLEAAAIAYDWKGFWARPEQIIPDGDWLSHGFLTGRGFGKTCSDSNFVVQEAKAGRAMRIGLLAQSEDDCIRMMVEGESGLISESPPWFKPEWEEKKKRLVWPNGAIALVYTPNAPGAIRGPEHHLIWTSEHVAWPKSTRDEAMMNLEFGNRIGYAKHIWETTPKRRDAMVRDFVQRSKRHPGEHQIVNGTTDDNRHNLRAEKIDELREKYGGTQKGREELEGIYSEDDEGALVKQAWIDDHRRDMPRVLDRRIVIVDPAISKRKSSDDTGISDEGLGVDGQIYVLGDHTGKYAWEEWGDIVLDLYSRGKCDCGGVERTRGGDAVAANLRARGQSPERVLAGNTISVQIVGADAKTRHIPRVVYVKEVHAYKSKEERAGPVASLYASGEVSHVNGADLADLEDLWCTWVPDAKSDSPDRLDPMVWGVWELRGLARDQRDGRGSVAAASKLQQRANGASGNSQSVSAISRLLGGRSGSRGL